MSMEGMPSKVLASRTVIFGKPEGLAATRQGKSRINVVTFIVEVQKVSVVRLELFELIYSI